MTSIPQRPRFPVTLQILAVLGAMLALSSARSSEVSWFPGTWEEARTVARVTRRPLMLEFYEVGCTHCARLDSALATAEASREAESFLAVRVELASAVGQELAKSLRVEGTPNIVFFDADGIETDRFDFVEKEPTSADLRDRLARFEAADRATRAAKR